MALVGAVYAAPYGGGYGASSSGGYAVPSSVCSHKYHQLLRRSVLTTLVRLRSISLCEQALRGV